MKKSYYFIISAIIVSLFFSITVNAATTNFSSSINDADGNTKTFNGVSYTSIPYDEMTNFENNSGGYDPVYKWHVNQNYRIEGFTSQKYYSGLMTWTINVTTSLTTDRNSPILVQNNVTDGLYVYIRYVQSTYYQVVVIMDNMFLRNTNIGLPTITQEFFISQSSQTPALLNITYQVIDKFCNVRMYDEPTDTGVAGMITDAIDNSTALSVISGWLYDIKEADYTYYQGIVSQMANILSAQNITNTKLQNILNEIDLDFQQVQTILDLFPSYRTQVLQYWQQLLEMNTAQSSEAAVQASEYADRDNQSATLLSGMNSLSMPSISSGDLNIIGSLDTTQKTNFFGLIGTITHTEIVTKIMLIIVLGAIVGYILYGKK